ncbi:MAG: hypothetical protein JO209_08355 [Acidisphaera sp.]|nr:hypothetical protein [Acidisphaera sp.]
MRKTLLAATLVATALAAGTAGSLVRDAAAQGAPPAPAGAPPPPTAEAAPPPPWMGGWMHRMHPGPMGDRRWGPMERGAGGPPMDGPMGGAMTFALLFRPADRALTAPDVQKIAEAFLLWNGNHTWKVTDVAESQDNAISFAVATQSGDVIARFSMDRRTGRLRRLG